MSRGLQDSRLLAAVVLAFTSIVAFADSHVRIVRLSYVDGQVQMDRATGSGLERAILNAPVLEGARIVTAQDGLAEVEFENGNTLRLAGDSDVRFSQLLMNDAGTKINEVTVVKGTVYLDTRAKGEDLYRIIADGSTFVAKHGTQLRLDASADQLRLAVLKGDVQLAAPEPVKIAHKETLVLNPEDSANYKLLHAVDKEPADAWSNERAAYSETYARSTGYGGPSSGFGLQDLNYYGDFFYVPGFGYGWQPFGFNSALASWSPYSNGAWTFCPGMGYAFSSFYPWGWLPYHYGSWAFVGGTGWVWLPGSSYGNNWYYNGYRNIPRIAKQPANWSPAAAPAVATAGSSNPTVIVGKTTSTAPAYIPGGRVPPNFASVIPGRTARVSVASGFARPDVKTQSVNGNVFERTNTAYVQGHSGRSGHVFAAPTNTSVLNSGYSAAPGLGASGARGGFPASTAGGHASAGHSSGGGHR